LDQKIADAVVVKAAKMADTISPSWPEGRRLEPGYRFCALPGVSQEGILAALRLLRLGLHVLSSSRLEQGILQTPYDTTWLSRTLDSVDGHDPKLISDLWQALFLLRPIPGKPTAASLRTMLSVLSAADHRNLAYPASAVLDSADHWFADNELRQVLQDVSIWANLGYGANINPFYVSLGDKLSREPEWQEIVSSDLLGWLEQFPTIIEPSIPGLRMNIVQNFDLFFLAYGRPMKQKRMGLGRRQPSPWFSVCWRRLGIKCIPQIGARSKFNII
jgi:hypothetical protein